MPAQAGVDTHARPQRFREARTARPGAVMFAHRLAVLADRPALEELAGAAIDQLQRDYLQPDQIAASRAIMGVDTQLIQDGTYFVVHHEGRLAGCGGWSRRATLYGGDEIAGRNDSMLDPAVDAARIRAMYTHPRFARRGVGRVVLSLCEAAAAAAGFQRLELMATMAGQPLYTSYGFAPVERVDHASGGAIVPLVRMVKPVTRRGASSDGP
ncbi:GNAT family N-acetyltransferase [Actinomadura sp. 6K520]|uniref:GNAT family N-acetyltransferase n=1 Tax=Actinomadura sp. 6K520 TaxID=2530364 RepID=UPI001A9D7024|nr:GNAT family N-acetyltransferase [Actinomadura sp. 6K520]